MSRRCTRGLAPAPVILVLVVAAGLLGACGGRSTTSGGPPASSAPATSSAAVPAPAAAAGQLGGPLTSQSVSNVEALLAGDGVATVPDETSVADLAPVSDLVGGVPVMTFTEAQVASMTVEAADHGGIEGSDLDSTYPMPSGDVPFSYLLAAWVSGGSTPAAAAVRSAMGAQDWSQAPRVPYPTVALALFTADVAHASVAELAPAATGAGAVAATTTAALMGAAGGACSTVSNFVQRVLDTVFHALQLGTPSGSSAISRIGAFFVNLWNVAVALAQQVITGLVKAVTDKIVAAMQAAAALAAVIAQVASDIRPWSVAVVAVPGSVEAGAGGTFVARVSSGPGPSSYPPAVSNCAQSLNVPLPNLSADGAAGRWSLSAGLAPTSSTSVTFDRSGSDTLGYETAAPPSSCTQLPPRTAGARVTVSRPNTNQLKDLVDSMLTNGFGVAGSIVSPVIQSILQPLVYDVLDRLAALGQVSGGGNVIITYPPPDSQSCTPTTTPPPSSTIPAAPGILTSCPSPAEMTDHAGELLSSLGESSSGGSPDYVTCNYLAPNCEPDAPATTQPPPCSYYNIAVVFGSPITVTTSSLEEVTAEQANTSLSHLAFTHLGPNGAYYFTANDAFMNLNKVNTTTLGTYLGSTLVVVGGDFTVQAVANVAAWLLERQS